ncbi:lysylphosphatidylglycerol synthase transmembrane domain-containing protein [Streptacidiphilus sp. PAMC 29251]
MEQSVDDGGVGVLPEALLLPARARRAEDLIRLVLGLLLIGLTLLVADAAQDTAGGLNADVVRGAGHAPSLLLGAARSLSTLAVLLLPVAFAAQRIIRRDTARLADGVLAAALAYASALAVDLWVTHLAPHPVVAALTHPAPTGSGATEPVLGHLALVLALMMAAGATKRPRWTAALLVLPSLDALTALAGGYTSALSLLLTLLIAWTVAHGTTYLLGAPNARPSLEGLFASLRRLGFTPVSAVLTPATTPHEPHHYLVNQGPGHQDLDIEILDRELSASGFLVRVWRHLRLRIAPQRRSLLSPRGALKQEALLCFAAQAAGVRTRQLLAASELGPDAALNVFEPLTGRTLDQLADAELTDTLLADAWEQLKLLRGRRIVHRTLVPASLIVDEHRAVHLVNLQDGDIAAGDIALRSDVAQLLTTLALRVGPERAVASSFAVLGREAVGASVPLLQPLALSGSTRAALKKATGPAPPPDLLAQIRDEILHTLPQAPVQPVRLERLRPRTLVTVFGGTVAGYFLVLQLSSGNGNPLSAFTRAQPGWVAFAALASVVSYVAATMSFVGFVPEKLNLRQAGLVQLAGSFVNLITPSGVGGMAINTRFLQRAGIPPRKAIASVGASQVIGLILHLLLVLVFGYLASGHYSPSLSASPTLIVGLLVAAVVVLAGAGVGPVRRRASARLHQLFVGVLPRLLDLLQHPRRLAVGIVGQLLVSLTSALCLYGCALALGQHPGFAAVAIADLIGGALGAAVPTPGGVGGVEAVLSGALAQTTGIPYADALTAVLLFRLLTFWLPVLPGWLAFAWLQRRKAL